MSHKLILCNFKNISFLIKGHLCFRWQEAVIVLQKRRTTVMHCHGWVTSCCLKNYGICWANVWRSWLGHQITMQSSSFNQPWRPSSLCMQVGDLVMIHADDLVQDCSNSSVLVMELLQPCTKQLINQFIVCMGISRPKISDCIANLQKLHLFYK